MKILLLQSLLYAFVHAGASKVNRTLLEKLAAAGHSCRVVAPATAQQAGTPQTADAFRQQAAVEGGTLTETAYNADRLILNNVTLCAVYPHGNLWQLAKQEIRSFQPDLLLITADDPSHLLLELAVDEMPDQTIYLAHTTNFLPFGPATFSADEKQLPWFRKLGGIVTQSVYVQDYFKRWGNLDSELLRVPIYGDGPFKQLGQFGKGHVTMINPCLYKGITIFTALAHALPEITFAAVETWGSSAEDIALLRSLPNVRLLSAENDIEKILAQTQIMLVPSLWDESFGLIVVETMLRGIPVLASNLGGLPEAKLSVDYLLPVAPLVTDHTGHSTAPAQNIAPWLTALTRLLTDEVHYDELATASFEAANQFVAELDLPSIEAYFERVVAAAQQQSPTGKPQQADSDLQATVRQLSPERRALLSQLIKQKQAQQPKTDAIVARPLSAETPLSDAQQRYWFIAKLTPHNAAYNITGAYRLSGTLNIAALAQSFMLIAERHAVLRSYYPEIAGQPAVAYDPPQLRFITAARLFILPNRHCAAGRSPASRSLSTPAVQPRHWPTHSLPAR